MIGFIVAGLVIGVLARLLLPGRQKIGLLWTLVLGVLGSVVGGVVANAIGSGDLMELAQRLRVHRCRQPRRRPAGRSRARRPRRGA